MATEEWVSWFGPDGVARHYRADTAVGQEIVRRLAEAEAATARYCTAPKPLYPNQSCGVLISGRKGQKYCSKPCALRASRASQ